MKKRFLILISLFYASQIASAQNRIIKSKLPLNFIQNKPITIINNDNILESTQAIISYSNSKSSHTGELYGIEFINNKWQVTFSTINCSLGRKGFADYDTKIEGDGKTPSGKFLLGDAFGYKKDLKTDINFIELNENHFWVSDTRSKLYNKLINYDPKDSYSEKMRRNDHLYKYGIVVEYNTDKIIKGKGSAIFIHIHRRKGSPTAGCLGISEEKIKELMKWIHPNKNPIIVMGIKNQIATYTNATSK